MRRLILACAAVAALLSCRSEQPAPEQVSPPTMPTPKAAVTVAKEDTLGFRLGQTSNPRQAFELLSGDIRNSHNKVSDGALVLASWAAEAPLSWSAMSKLPKTTYRQVMKDPQTERGKLLCASGTVQQITVDRSVGPPIYEGTLVASGGKWIRYFAVRSTGDLVADSRGRICGLVTERHSYENLAGGVTESVLVVGMFDLPKNRQSL